MSCRELLSCPSRRCISAFARASAAFPSHQSCPRCEGRCNEIYSASTLPSVEQFPGNCIWSCSSADEVRSSSSSLHQCHRILRQYRFLFLVHCPRSRLCCCGGPGEC